MKERQNVRVTKRDIAWATRQVKDAQKAVAETVDWPVGHRVAKLLLRRAKRLLAALQRVA